MIDDAETRRSLYVKVRRSQPVAMLQAFDAPVMEVNCERRPVSTVATQSLMMMNSGTILHHSAMLAERCRAEAAAIPEDRLATLPTLPAPPNEAWQYGYGSYNESTKLIDSFTPLGHFTGAQWQASATLPDPQLGYVLLRGDGGHPDSPGRAVIRRWVAPKSGTLTITGKLQHGSPNGDGVRARVVSSRAAIAGNGLLGEWISFNNAVDFIVECQANHTSDSFLWPVTIEFASADGQAQSFAAVSGFHGPSEPRGLMAGQVVRAWQLAYCREPDAQELVSAMGFLADQIGYIHAHRDQLPEGVSDTRQAMTDLCQALLTSNEFLYVK